MSASQQHGFEIEKIILADLAQRSRLTKKIPLASSHVSQFDAPGYSDPYAKGIPTSIKTAKLNNKGDALVCMADATRIGQLGEVPMMRLLVALYEQKGDHKVFSEIREFLITDQEWAKALGNVSSETLSLFNKAIKLPDPTKARKVAKEWQAKLRQAHPSAMRWNPKIDSKGQRRLQCSIPLSALSTIIADPKRIRVFGNAPGATAPRLWGNGTPFPITLVSAPRVRHPKASSGASGKPTKPSKTASKTSAKKPKQRALG